MSENAAGDQRMCLAVGPFGPAACSRGRTAPRTRYAYPGAGVSSVRNRTRLYAAVAKVKIQPTVSVPR